MLGIFGLIGAGRTELLRALFGLEPVREGRVRVGRFEGSATPDLRWRQGVGLVSEDRAGEGLAPHLSVAGNLCLPSLASLGTGGLLPPGREERAAETWIERFGIRCHSPRQRITSAP